MTPRDEAELALSLLHRHLDGSVRDDFLLFRAEERLREAGLHEMAGVVAEYRARAGGDDRCISELADQLWVMLDDWPVTEEPRVAA